jgi:hypothetical protein
MGIAPAYALNAETEQEGQQRNAVASQRLNDVINQRGETRGLSPKSNPQEIKPITYILHMKAGGRLTVRAEHVEYDNRVGLLTFYQATTYRPVAYIPMDLVSMVTCEDFCTISSDVERRIK